MDANEVKVIRWPKGQEKRALYRDLRVFRLLVVDPASPAPICTDSRADWIRAPIVRDDFNARLTSLRVKANNFRLHIDENQVLHVENRAVPLIGERFQAGPGRVTSGLAQRTGLPCR